MAQSSKDTKNIDSFHFCLALRTPLKETGITCFLWLFLGDIILTGISTYRYICKKISQERKYYIKSVHNFKKLLFILIIGSTYIYQPFVLYVCMYVQAHIYVCLHVSARSKHHVSSSTTLIKIRSLIEFGAHQFG